MMKKALVVGLLLIACNLEASTKRRAVDPTFPAFHPIQWSCWIAADPDNQLKIEIVKAYVNTHWPAPYRLVEDLQIIDNMAYTESVLKDQYACVPPTSFQYVSWDEAMRIYDAYKEVMYIYSLIPYPPEANEAREEDKR